ncbi:MAG: Ku protein [Gemmatimonadota bacterium]|nr:MAG: Ku protein [Gemmatimonadota bacterium]
MAMRPIGSATISFGLVSVPVNLYSVAESAANISFNWIHRDCGSRVKQRYYCPTDDALVEREDLVKGYQYAKDQYVLFEPEEIKELEAVATNAIDIAEFIPLEQVERTELSKAYYLGPDKGGERAYRLLSAALSETGRAALATYAARGKQYLVLVRPIEDGLLLEQLHYADELRPFSEVPLGDGEVKKEELKLAVQLIEQAATDEYRPEQYEDEVRKRVLALIEQKIETGTEITAAPLPPTETKVIDLMEALKASLGAGGADSEAAGKRKAAKRSATGRKSSKKAASGG